jgi:hypothetical protein
MKESMMTTTERDTTLTAAARQAQQPGIRRTDLQRHELSAQGREVIQSRVDFHPRRAGPPA